MESYIILGPPGARDQLPLDREAIKQALRTHNGSCVPDGCGPDSALRWLRALQTICRPVTCRGR